LALFEKLLGTSCFSIFEGSIRISGEDFRAERFRLGSAGQTLDHAFDEICWFLDLVSEHENVFLDRNVLEKIVRSMSSMSGVYALGAGLEISEKIGDSKTKCYFMVDKKDEIVDLVLGLHPKVKGIEHYLVDDTFLFAVEMHFDGRNDIEIYPRFKTEYLRNSILIKKLGFQVQVQRLLKGCRALTVSFEKGEARILHFHPMHPTRFVRSLANRPLSLVYSNIQALDMALTRFSGAEPVDVSLAFSEKEVVAETLKDINLYYRVSAPL